MRRFELSHILLIISLSVFAVPAQKICVEKGDPGLYKYAVADYNLPEPADPKERELRKLKNKRYDDQGLVMPDPRPDDAGVSVTDEMLPEMIIPAEESNLIFVGEIIKVTAHVSNDKRGVYSEFTIRLDQILKDDAKESLRTSDLVTADREGGCVRYPNGQKLFHDFTSRALPFAGGQYLFFLKRDKENPNYRIITLYLFQGEKIVRLNREGDFRKFENATKTIFLEAVRKEIAHPTKRPEEEILPWKDRRKW